MNIILNRNKKYFFLLLSIACLAFNACQTPKTKKAIKPKPKPTFKSVWGIGYTEVKRKLASGLTFGKSGYQLVPTWRLSFPSDDSVNIYNPQRKIFVNAPIILDHDSVFNIAWAYLRLKKLSRDSIIFQVLKVDDTVIENDRSVVYMILYANDYIKNVLHQDPLKINYTTRLDTEFIRKKVLMANQHPDSAFSATDPVKISSISPKITVEKRDVPEDERGPDEPDYMLPQFNITINKAYDHFSYGFNALVDEKGNIQYVSNVLTLDPSYEKGYADIIKGIIKGYFKVYLKVKPGKTLGMAHSSRVVIYITGMP